MPPLSTLTDTVQRACTRLAVLALHGLVAALSAILLGLQHFLTWADGPHPAAIWLKSRALWVLSHPRQCALAIGSALLALAGGAFAVVSLGPDAAQLPVAQVTESLEVPNLDEQANALRAHPLRLLRSDTTRANEGPEALLRRLGATDPEAAQLMRSHPQVREALANSGRLVTATTTAQQRLVQLSVRWLRQDSDTQFQRLTLQRNTDGLQVRQETAPMTTSTRVSGGAVNSSLYAASDEARLPDAVVNQLTHIFSSQIDFHRSLRKGARFGVVYEVLEADGEPVRTGKVLSAEFVNGETTYQAVWFQEPGQKGGYYSPDGKSLRRAYLAAPVAYSRKSSGMGTRLHPIFQTRHIHRGIDYAAPHGTPAYAVGDGVVESAGWKNGYGNVVVVRHNAQHRTLYAHLSRMHVRNGQSVNQGQSVGAVGSTGWSTGPHLHFEFHVNGVYTDPQRVIQQAQTAPITAALKPAFAAHTQAARQHWAAAGQMRDGNSEW